MTELTPLQVRARLTALEVFSTRFIILQLKQLENDYGREKVADLIDKLDQQIAETVARVSLNRPDEVEFSREVDEHINWLMGLLRGQFKKQPQEGDET